MDTTLIVGASSTVGRAATRHLVAAGTTRVVAATRDPARIVEPGAEPVVFDWTDQGTWAAALEGVGRIFLVVPETSQEAPMLVRQLLGRAVAAGVRRVVTLSARGVDEFPGHPLQVVDAAVVDMAPQWVILRPNWFMHNFTAGVFHDRLVREEVISAPGGPARISFVDADDVGAVAAALLGDDVDPGALNRSYDLTGPRALTFAEVAAAISHATTGRVRYEEVGLDDPDLPAKVGVPGVDRRMVVALFSRVVDGGEASVSDDVRAVLGREPTCFEDFAAASSSVLARSA